VGVKLGRSHLRRNVGWRCLRKGCWGRYFCPRGPSNRKLEAMS